MQSAAIGMFSFCALICPMSRFVTPIAIVGLRCPPFLAHASSIAAVLAVVYTLAVCASLGVLALSIALRAATFRVLTLIFASASRHGRALCCNDWVAILVVCGKTQATQK